MPTSSGVQVEDSTGKALAEAGLVVTASIASGPAGTLAGASATTAASGLATFAGLAISGPVGTYTLRFSTPSAAAVTSGAVTLGAGAAAQLLIAVQPSSAAQSGVAFAQQPVIQIADVLGNPVASGGVTVTAKIASGAGTLAGTTTIVTGTSGAATFANLSIGGPLGARTLGFTASSLTGAVSNSISVSAGPPSAIGVSAGGNQSAPTGTATPVPPSVIVTDAFGNPVAGVSVTFTAAEGAVTGTNPAVTGSSGVAAIGSWTLGAQAGADTLRATAAGLSGSPVVFVAIATASVSVSAALSTVAASPGTIVASTGGSASTITVTAKDGSGNPISGATVVLAATGAGNTLTQPTATTNASGVVTGFLSSTGAGAKTVSATINGTAITQTASVTVTAAAASSMAPSAGTNQSATVGTAVPVPPAVVLKDAFGNLVAGVSVTFAVGSGGGTVTLTVVSTNASGIASPTSWVLGTTAGVNAVSASVTGVSGSPVTFSATGDAGPTSLTNSLVAATPANVVASSGGSAATVTVTVRDSYGNPVSGATVTLGATGGWEHAYPAGRGDRNQWNGGGHAELHGGWE